MTRRQVLGYQSLVMFDPDTVIEIFVLNSAGEGSEAAQATAEDQMTVDEATPRPVLSAQPGSLGSGAGGHPLGQEPVTTDSSRGATL